MLLLDGDGNNPWAGWRDLDSPMLFVLLVRSEEALDTDDSYTVNAGCDGVLMQRIVPAFLPKRGMCLSR
jgi:hypothetical protein